MYSKTLLLKQQTKHNLSLLQQAQLPQIPAEAAVHDAINAKCSFPPVKTKAN